MKLEIALWNGQPCPVFEEEPIPRSWLLQGYVLDLDGQEDLYLSFIAKAEAGEIVLDLYNNHVDAQLYPDGRVILEEMRWSDDDEAELGPPARTELTLAEAKQLILDWLAAKKQWRAQQADKSAAMASAPATGSSAPVASVAIPAKSPS